MLEAQIFKKTGKLIKLSEQQLLECTNSNQWQGNGCKGGVTRGVLKYIQVNGVTTSDKYVRPYTANDSLPCNYKASNAAVKIEAYYWPQGINENYIKNLLSSFGPLIVTLDASLPTFLHYKSGVYKDPKCSSSKVNHAMLLCGYDRDPIFGDYWLIKNSYGPNWGEAGYFRLERGKNRCGMTVYVLYATV